MKDYISFLDPNIIKCPLVCLINTKSVLKNLDVNSFVDEIVKWQILSYY